MHLRLPRTDASCNGGGSLGCGNDGRGGRRADSWFFADRGSVYAPVGSYRERSDLPLRRLVKNEPFGRTRSTGFRALGCVLSRGARDSKDAPARFGAGEKVLVRVEGQNANVRLVARIKQFALAVGRHGKKLTFVTRGDVKCPIRGKGQIPDVFCFGVKENGLLAGCRNLVDLAVRRSADVKRAFRVEDDGLRRQVRGIEHDLGLRIGIKAKHLCGRTACCVKHTFWVEANAPQIRGIGVREQSEFGSKFETTIAAHCDTVGCAPQEFFVGGLAPAARVLREKR